MPLGSFICIAMWLAAAYSEFKNAVNSVNATDFLVGCDLENPGKSRSEVVARLGHVPGSDCHIHLPAERNTVLTFHAFHE
ncbi:MAG: hypothetical protein OXI81_10880 [Paracoccaceae bacterium]|nr:hypothetical protein [Paracoccaceae bacterium]